MAPAFSPEELAQAVHDNLRNLGLDVLEVVNLRAMFDAHGPAEGSVEPPLTVLAELQQRGLVRHVGLSHFTPAQIAEARRICEIVCVQNQYNLAHRGDDAMVDDLARVGIAYVPFFPLEVSADLDLSKLSHAEKDTLILTLLARPDEAHTLIAELQARIDDLTRPGKTPNNSSVPRSKGHKPNRPDKAKREGPRKGSLDRKGGGRPLTAEPDEVVLAKAVALPRLPPLGMLARCRHGARADHSRRPAIAQAVRPRPRPPVHLPRPSRDRRRQ